MEPIQYIFKLGHLDLLWKIDYEVAAISILLVIYIFMQTRYILPTEQARIFKNTMQNLLLCAFFDVVTSITLSYTSVVPLWFNVLLLTIYFTFVATLPATFLAYIFTVVHHAEIIRTKRFYALLIPTAALLLVVFTNPFTGLIFKIVDGNYITGPLWIGTFLTPALYFIVGVGTMLRYRESVSKEKRVAFLVFSAVTVVLVINQLTWLKGYLLLYLSSGVLGIILYMCVENPAAYLDKESGLINREGFRSTIAALLEKNDKPFRIAFYDATNLKEISRVYGRSGEAKLRDNVVAKLNELLEGENTTIFMIESGLFATLSDKAIDFQQIRNRLGSQHGVSYEGVKVEMHGNVCVIDSDCSPKIKTVNDILTLAEYTLAIQRESKKTYVYVGEEEIRKHEREVQVKAAVKRAIEQESIEVVYQPICDPFTGKVVAAEALARLYDPEIGNVSPVEFIACAERDATIIELGKQIFKKVCRFISEQNMEKLGIKYISVNFSPLQCLQMDLEDDIIHMMRQFNVEPKYITIELTESVQIHSKDTIREMMNSFKSNGIRFSLDDYGTGYSNITYVTGMPFDIIKIDRSIVLLYFNDKNPLMKYTIEMFKKLGYTIVAEGVEERWMVDELREMGCDTIQGYVFSKPLKGSEFITYVKLAKE